MLDFLVSKDIGNLFFINNFKILLTLRHSKLSLIAFDPGLVDSPPTSIKFAPWFIKFWVDRFFFCKIFRHLKSYQVLNLITQYIWYFFEI